MVRYVSSLVRWLSTMKYLNRWIVLVLDLSLSLLSAVVSYLLVLAFLQIQFNRGELYRFVCFALVAGLLIQLVFKLYRGIIRHASIQEASRLLAALFCKELILLIAILLYSGFSSQWLAIVLLDLLISFFLVISVRALLVSIYFTLVGGNLNGNRLLFIYGTDNHSIALINWVRSGALHPYVAVGLLSTDMSQSGLRIGGLPVFAISTPDSFRKLLTHVRRFGPMLTEPESLQICLFCILLSALL